MYKHLYYSILLSDRTLKVKINAYHLTKSRMWRNYKAFTPKNIKQPLKNTLQLHTRFPCRIAERKKQIAEKYVKHNHVFVKK